MLIALDQFENFTRIGEAAGLVFRVDQLAVDLDVEDSAGTLDQPGLFTESFLKFGRQTGGFRKVVSLAAVFNSYLHEFYLLFGCEGLGAETGTCIGCPPLDPLSFYPSGQCHVKRRRQHASRSPPWQPVFREW